MGATEPRPLDPSEFDLRLRQVFLIATERFRLALQLEAEVGGYLQGFVGSETIPEPTIAFKLMELSPKVIDGRVSKGEWIVYVPEAETGDTFLNRLWLERVIRATDSRTSTIVQIDKNGSTLISTDDTLIGLPDLVDSPDSAGFGDDLSLIGLESVVDLKVDNLKRIARSMEDDFLLIQYNS